MCAAFAPVGPRSRRGIVWRPPNPGCHTSPSVSEVICASPVPSFPPEQLQMVMAFVPNGSRSNRRRLAPRRGSGRGVVALLLPVDEKDEASAGRIHGEESRATVGIR